MRRIVISMIVGSIIGGVIFFPPSIPFIFTLVDRLDADGFAKYESAISWLFVVLPVIGSVIGAMIGRLIGTKKISLALFRRKSCSILFWCIFTFSLLGLELGFAFSPVMLIGLGNTSTVWDLWLFSFILGIVGIILGAFVGLLVLWFYFVMNNQ